MLKENNIKILITGGSGFIGSSLVKKWLHEGHSIRILDNGMRGKLRRLASVEDDIEYIQGDVRNFDDVNNACNGMDAIAHLAYINGTEFFYTKPELILEIALKGMINTIDAALKNNIGQYWLMSSGEVYQTPEHIPTNESVSLKVPDPLNPRYSYGGGKIISELYALNYGLTNFDKVVVVRPHNVYGPDMGWEHVVPQFILRANDLSNDHQTGLLPFKIQGDGSHTRAFCFIDDFVAGAALAFEKGGHREIYHVGTTEEVSIAQVAQKIASSMGREARLIRGNEPAGQTLRRCPDISKVSSLGYRPKTNLDAGLENTIGWYLQNLELRSTNTFASS